MVGYYSSRFAIAPPRAAWPAPGLPAASLPSLAPGSFATRCRPSNSERDGSGEEEEKEEEWIAVHLEKAKVGRVGRRDVDDEVVSVGRQALHQLDVVIS